MDPGTIVAERFIIERAAGSGAMGAIYRALDQQTGEPVALKVLLVDRPTFADRFVREARVLADLQHPRIVRYVAHGLTDDKKMFLAMEWLEGTDLEQHLA